MSTRLKFPVKTHAKISTEKIKHKAGAEID